MEFCGCCATAHPIRPSWMVETPHPLRTSGGAGCRNSAGFVRAICSMTYDSIGLAMNNGGRLLAVDGGGSSTEAWLTDYAGWVLGRGQAGPSNAKAVGLDLAR